MRDDLLVRLLGRLVPGLNQGSAQGQPRQDVSASIRVIDSLLAHDAIRKTVGDGYCVLTV